jgi:hypothetical protein
VLNKNIIDTTNRLRLAEETIEDKMMTLRNQTNFGKTEKLAYQ